MVLRRRDPLSDALEVDLDGVHGAAHDRRRFGASHVVEVGRLRDERRRPIRRVVDVAFRQRPRHRRLSQILTYNTTVLHRYVVQAFTITTSCAGSRHNVPPLPAN